jgi:hypothetical protein
MLSSFFLFTCIVLPFALAQWPPDYANLDIKTDLQPVESQCGTQTLPIHFNAGIRDEMNDENSALSMMLKAACSKDFQASHPVFGETCDGSTARTCTLTAETAHYKATYSLFNGVSAGFGLFCLEAPVCPSSEMFVAFTSSFNLLT